MILLVRGAYTTTRVSKQLKGLLKWQELAQACRLKHWDCNYVNNSKTHIIMNKNTQTKAASQIMVLIEDEGGLDFITVKTR